MAESKGLDKILQGISANDSILIFASIYYLVSWIILIGSWAEKQYNGIHSGHMNMFFSLILMSYGLLYSQGNKRTNDSNSGPNYSDFYIMHALVALDVVCTGFIALTTTTESLYIYCKHAVKQDKRSRNLRKKGKKVQNQKEQKLSYKRYVMENPDTDYTFEEWRKSEDYTDNTGFHDGEYGKVKDPLSNLNEPVAILLFSVILLRFGAGICLVILAAFLSNNEYIPKFMKPSTGRSKAAFIGFYFLIILISFILYGEVKKYARNKGVTTEEMYRCKYILDDEGVDTDKLIGTIDHNKDRPKKFTLFSE